MGPSDETPPPATPYGEWIVAARKGSKEALGHLLETCRHYLLLVANEQLRDNLQAKVGASDLVQETFLKAHQGFDRFEGQTEAELLAWLRRILLNTLVNQARHYQGTDKREVAREVPLADAQVAGGPMAGTESPSAQAMVREQTEALQQALAQLPEHYRQVVCWRNYERLSFEEIGQRLGRTAEAARKLWGRAIEQLQELLESSDAE